MKKIFVTGISTNIGKTVVSAILAEALQADYWKPVQAGSFSDTDSVKVQKLISNTKSKIHPEAYCLMQPISPHAAAKMEGIRIELDKINVPQTDNTLIIEGVGGLMVPLNEKELVIDMIKKLDAEVVLVVANYLGSINHTLLSLEALQKRNIKLKSIIFNGAPLYLSEEVLASHGMKDVILRVFEEDKVDKDMILKYAAKVNKDLLLK